MTVRIVDRVRAAAPSGAVELQVVSLRVDRSVSSGLSHWVGDALWGSDAPGAETQRPLRIASVHWVSPGDPTTSIDLADDEYCGPDDLAALLDTARHRNVAVTAWSQPDAPRNAALQLDSTWFRSTASPPSTSIVKHQATADGVTITVDDEVSGRVAWLLMYPALVFSFAWVFFLVLGVLPRMVRDIWHRATGGVTQSVEVTVGKDTVTIAIERDDRDGHRRSFDRSDLLALGPADGMTAYTTNGAVPISLQWVSIPPADAFAVTNDLVARINRALGVS